MSEIGELVSRWHNQGLRCGGDAARLIHALIAERGDAPQTREIVLVTRCGCRRALDMPIDARTRHIDIPLPPRNAVWVEDNEPMPNPAAEVRRFDATREVDAGRRVYIEVAE